MRGCGVFSVRGGYPFWTIQPQEFHGERKEGAGTETGVLEMDVHSANPLSLVPSYTGLMDYNVSMYDWYSGTQLSSGAH